MLAIVPGLFSSHDHGFGHGIPAEEEQRMPAPRNSVPKVLVVDDEQLIADTLTEILKRNGFDAMVAYGGQQAL